jgi:hypothetical protein
MFQRRLFLEPFGGLDFKPTEKLPPSFQHWLVASVAILAQASYREPFVALQVLLLACLDLVLGF